MTDAGAIVANGAKKLSRKGIRTFINGPAMFSLDLTILSNSALLSFIAVRN